MSKRESIARYNLIIKKLKHYPSSFDEIMRYLEEESSIQGYNFVVSKRTFQRDIQDISLAYNIDIAYNRSQGVYFIEEELNPEANNRMLEAFDMFNAFNITERISQYIHFEKRKPQRTENLYGLLHAIENRHKVLFNYQKYWEGTITNRTVEPYALKEFRYRWYVMARDMNDNKIKSFALDRLSDLEISKESFSMPEDFNIEAHFQYSFGIISPNEKKLIVSCSHLRLIRENISNRCHCIIANAF